MAVAPGTGIVMQYCIGEINSVTNPNSTSLLAMLPPPPIHDNIQAAAIGIIDGRDSWNMLLG
jgi:hypothetical protein